MGGDDAAGTFEWRQIGFIVGVDRGGYTNQVNATVGNCLGIGRGGKISRFHCGRQQPLYRLIPDMTLALLEQRNKRLAQVEANHLVALFRAQRGQRQPDITQADDRNFPV